MTYYKEITDDEYKINGNTFYRFPGSTDYYNVGGSHYGKTLKYMKQRHKGIIIFEEVIESRFKTNKPYPYGY